MSFDEQYNRTIVGLLEQKGCRVRRLKKLPSKGLHIEQGREIGPDEPRASISLSANNSRFPGHYHLVGRFRVDGLQVVQLPGDTVSIITSFLNYPREIDIHFLQNMNSMENAINGMLQEFDSICRDVAALPIPFVFDVSIKLGKAKMGNWLKTPDTAAPYRGLSEVVAEDGTTP
jgi:hypothetical protein